MEPFLGEIRIVGFNYAPRGWALCNGQILRIQQNSALYSILGVTYGGDGVNTFALPNLQGRAPLHPGQGAGLSRRTLGESGGQASVTLTTEQIPAHNHRMLALNTNGSQVGPGGALWARAVTQRVYTSSAANAAMRADGLAASGGGAAHNNMPPFLVMNFIIALVGIFPQRP